MISKPEFQSNGGIYLFHWKPEGIKIRIDRLLEDSKLTVAAEVTVTAEEQGEWLILHRARLNLTSTNSQTAFTKKLTSVKNKDKQKLEVDWATIIGQASVKTLDWYRQGEPVITLGQLNPIPAVEWLVYPIIVKGEHNILFGDGGTGKSYIANFLALLVQFNYACLDLVPQQGNVLFLDWEADRETLERRTFALKQGLGIQEKKSFLYRFCEQPLPYDIEQIRSIVIDNNISLVIADSAGMAAGVDGEYHSTAIKYIRALRTLRTTVLSIDHIAKNEGSVPFGSVYKRNLARSAFEIKHSQHPGQQDLYVGLFHRKMNEGKLQEPMGFHIHFEGQDPGGVTVEKQDILSVPELADGLTLKERARKELSSGAMSVEALADALQGSEQTIRRILYRYRNKLFIQLEGGYWGLLSEQEELL